MLSKEANIARVKPLGFVEVRFAGVPLTAPSGDIGQRLGDAAVIGEELTCLLKITCRSVVILQAGVVVIALSHQRFAETRLKR